MSAGARNTFAVRHRLSQRDHSVSSMGMPTMEPEFITVLIPARYFLQNNNQNDDGIVMVDDYEDITTLPLHLFDSASSLLSPLSQCLSRLGVPEAYQNHLLPEISHFGKLMATDPQNSNFMILQMGLEIEILTFQGQNENLDAAMARAVRRGEEPVHEEPSHQSDLENFRVEREDLSLIPECAICLEKPCVWERVTRLPCYHTFHWDCIASWLIRNNQCPLCRHHVRLY